MTCFRPINLRGARFLALEEESRSGDDTGGPVGLPADTDWVPTPPTPVALTESGERGLVLPWVTPGQRRSPILEAATPLLVAAMRRLFAGPDVLDPATLKPGEVDRYLQDTEALDKGRATLRRVHHAGSWNRMHPSRARPFMYYLPHAGYVLRAVGLAPSVVHRTRCALELGRDASDEDMLRCAHLSAVSCFDASHLSRLHLQYGWTVEALIDWSERYDLHHFEQASKAGWGWAELGDLMVAGEVPDAGQVELMLAFKMAPPDPAAA